MLKDQIRSSRNFIRYWLASGCLLIFLMVIVGGITRLTGSGLSITEWNVVTGTLPPLSEQAWEEEFDKYKQIPQFKMLNSAFELADFKRIYFWEYIHRLIGRLIGLVFMIPFLYLYIKKKISRALMPRLLVMFLLGALQGVVGWYMVKSGLTENTKVSHYRLALHLGLAFITFGYIFYVLLQEEYHTSKESRIRLPMFNFPLIFLILIFTQVIIGAFVAGMHSGYIYNTWPKMEGQWIPDAVPFAWEKEGWRSMVNNIVTVQFIHRKLAYLITVFVLAWWYLQKKRNLHGDRKSRAANMVLGLVCLQVGLGIFTLLARVPVTLGVLHQAVAFILFAAAIHLFFIHRYKIA